MFVHDFIELDLPLEVVLDTLAGDVELPLDELVASAWTLTVGTWDGDDAPAAALAAPHGISVTLGSLRFRRRSVVVALGWSDGGHPWFPALDADLEIVALGSRRTNLHLMGRYRFGPTAPPWSDLGTTANLFTVLTVRRFLALLANRISERCSQPAVATAAAVDSRRNGRS
jgi:hypothetical protein